jgi:hypothetical protein
MKQSNYIDLIMNDLAWLDANKQATNIGQISLVLNHLSLLSVNLGEEVCQAYANMNNLEDEYKGAFADFVKDFNGSVAKAEISAESELKGMKKNWTTAKNGYKKLSTFMDRLDRVFDSFRQQLSISKLEIKNI